MEFANLYERGMYAATTRCPNAQEHECVFGVAERENCGPLIRETPHGAVRCNEIASVSIYGEALANEIWVRKSLQSATISEGQLLLDLTLVGSWTRDHGRDYLEQKDDNK